MTLQFKARAHFKRRNTRSTITLVRGEDTMFLQFQQCGYQLSDLWTKPGQPVWK
jgi:hypothetical protein